jgi:ubiquinone/menaquinone biosynthesis C-methylase UbiE
MSEPVPVTRAASQSIHRGIGRWAIEVAQKYPSSQVFGIDLAPTQPEDFPTNCKFIIGDAIVELPEFYDCSADVINSRYELARGVRRLYSID